MTVLIIVWTLHDYNSWWRHQMETFSALLALCAGNSPVTGEFPAQSPVTRSFDVSLICASIHGWANNRKAGNLRCHRAHYDVTVSSADCTFRHASFPRILDFQQVFANNTTFSKRLSRLQCSHNQNKTTKQNKIKHYMSVKTSQITDKSFFLQQHVQASDR